jgi:transketolase
LPWLNRLDDDWFAEVVRDVDHVVALDNHYVTGGQGAMLAGAVARLQPDARPAFHHIGLNRLPSCGQPDEVLRAHGLDAESLGRTFRALIGATELV